MARPFGASTFNRGVCVNMYRIIVVFVLVSLALSACGDDDKAINPTGSNVAGTWTGQDTFEGIFNVSLVLRLSSDSSFTMDYTLNDFLIEYEGTYSLKGNTITLNASTIVFDGSVEDGNNFEPLVGTFSEDGKVLSLVADSESGDTIKLRRKGR